ncbi:MAG: 2,3-bisphosphoglycerate-independent phosphoglycerate mutase [Gammaproteobacteria bacterium]|nr:2,3-bisphosphoglycerate-independent phosphoglycerate mutase [Gammaproteobacteria bacterium]
MSNPGKRTPTLLVILDGWGHAARSPHNAISEANTPVWDALLKDSPFSLLDCSGESVGLPAGQMGNSEVGHMHIGAGRVVHQELTRINHAFAEEGSREIDALKRRLKAAGEQGRAVHLLGLVSAGGVHSHESHFHQVIALCEQAGVARTFVHAFLDGRDTPPRSALPSLDAMPNLASVMGRFYAMDRDNRWERTKAAYDLLVAGRCAFWAGNANHAIKAAYERDESDEFVQPTMLEQFKPIEQNDLVIFMNFRADRARQLTRVFTEASFDHFERERPPRLAAFLTMTRYADDITATPIFDREVLVNTLPQVLADAGRTQLRIAETEKYAHVTYFFSGGREERFTGENRILVPSPKVATYDLQPEMSAAEVTDKLVEEITACDTDFIVCNFANPDMVGHTGKWEASLQAVETIDACLQRIINALGKVDGQMLITSDHGNIEDMLDAQTGQAQTAHTTSKVPLVYVGAKRLTLTGGSLADLAPTLLDLMALPKPQEMTGNSLIHKVSADAP